MVTNSSTNTPTGANGTILQGQGIGSANAFSTATFPSTATGTGTILRADGTNWAATTATYPATTTVNQILYSSSANVVTGLATANSGVLTTSSAGIPSIDTTNFSVLATGVQMKANNTNTAPPAGFIGQQILSTVAPGSAISLTSLTSKNITSISLTAGNWNISGFSVFNNNITGSTQIVLSISTTTDTLGTNDGYSYSNWAGTLPTTISPTIPSFRVSLSGTTTYYLVAYSQFASGTSTACGTITATRVG